MPSLVRIFTAGSWHICCIPDMHNISWFMHNQSLVIINLSYVQLLFLCLRIPDHVAVALYLLEDFHSLELHFPAKWQASSVDPQFQSSSECDDYLKNPGGVANRYHKLFSAKIEDNSLLQIESAIAVGATVREHKGFHERNTAVAQSPYLLAFTWGEGEEPKKGGTYNTWMKCRGTRLHIPLSSLVLPDEKKSPFKARKSPRKSPRKYSRKSFSKTRERGKITGYCAKKSSKFPTKMSPTTQSYNLCMVPTDEQNLSTPLKLEHRNRSSA